MPRDLVTIAQYEFLPEASAAQLFLESEGIPAYLLDGELVTTQWLFAAAVGFIKLQVSRTQAEAAVSILEKLQANKREAKERDAETPEAGRCLVCNTLLGEDQITCPACGWSYTNDEEDVTAQDLQDRQVVQQAASVGSSGQMSKLIGLRRKVFLILFAGIFSPLFFALLVAKFPRFFEAIFG